MLAPGTPAEASLKVQTTVGRRTGSAEREGSSPAYIVEERAEEPLPPTPTYSGSSPTYLDENEPATPTLEADDDDLYGEEDLSSVTTGLLSAMANFRSGRFARGDGSSGTPPGTPLSGQPRTPLAVVAGLTGRRQPITPFQRTGGVPPRAFTGAESPTPTFDPDDEDAYAEELISFSFVLSAGTGRLAVSSTAPRPSLAAGQPAGPGTPASHPGTPQSVRLGTATPLSGPPGTPQSLQPGTPQGLVLGAHQPGTPVEAVPQPPLPSEPAPLPPSAAAATATAYDPFAPEAPGSTGPAPAMPPLASEVFPAHAGRRRQRGTASSDEELPPWKRRQRTRQQ